MNQKHKTYCCGMPMRSFGLVYSINPCVDSIHRWVCEVCGHGIDVIHFDFDELEVQHEINGEAATPFPYHQLKGGDG